MMDSILLRLRQAEKRIRKPLRNGQKEFDALAQVVVIESTVWVLRVMD